MRRTAFVLALATLALTVAPRGHAGTPTYSFAIPPQQAPLETAKRWTPVMNYLSEKIGVEVLLTTSKDFATFHAQLKKGEYDFSYVNPRNYVQANKAAGYLAIAKETGGKTVGLIVAKKGGAVKSLADLKGQVMALPGPTAFAATFLPINELKNNGVHVTPQYVVSIDSVYRSVAKGLYPAGGGEGRTFGALDPEVKKDLVVLWESVALPPFAFFAHPRVPQEITAKMQKALASMDEDPQGAVLLQTLNIKALETATDSDYDVVRKMKFSQDNN